MGLLLAAIAVQFIINGAVQAYLNARALSGLP
jgi:small neutral amino acid transporter SnatA (MarC family)